MRILNLMTHERRSQMTGRTKLIITLGLYLLAVSTTGVAVGTIYVLLSMSEIIRGGDGDAAQTMMTLVATIMIGAMAGIAAGRLGRAITEGEEQLGIRKATTTNDE